MVISQHLDEAMLCKTKHVNSSHSELNKYVYIRDVIV